MALIAINIAVFIWQLSYSSGQPSGQTPNRGFGADQLLSKRDQLDVSYGAIPYRVVHPGDKCGLTVTDTGSGTVQPQVVCQGQSGYSQAASAHQLAKIKQPLWIVTLFTAMFMHGGILHILFNMLFLWVFGANVEDAMGRVKFGLFYLLAGLVAAYSQALISQGATVPTIGASGAVAGVLGAYALLYPRARVLSLIFIIFFVTLVEIPALILLAIWFALQFIPAVGQVATPGVGGTDIAYFAHVGGFIFGLLAVWLFARGRVRWPLRAA